LLLLLKLYTVARRATITNTSKRLILRLIFLYHESSKTQFEKTDKRLYYQGLPGSLRFTLGGSMSEIGLYQGRIVYPNKQAIATAIQIMLQSGHLEMQDDVATWIEADEPAIEEPLTLTIPYGTYQNLYQFLTSLTETSKDYNIRWASNDGSFQGQILTHDALPETVELEEWAEQNSILLSSPRPSTKAEDDDQDDDDDDQNNKAAWESEVMNVFVNS
jgi:hypothetical protein